MLWAVFLLLLCQSGFADPIGNRCLGELMTKLLEPTNKDFERVRAEGYPYSFWAPMLKVRGDVCWVFSSLLHTLQLSLRCFGHGGPAGLAVTCSTHALHVQRSHRHVRCVATSCVTLVYPVPTMRATPPPHPSAVHGNGGQ